MKKVFSEAEIEVTIISATDVITDSISGNASEFYTSGSTTSGWDEENW